RENRPPGALHGSWAGVEKANRVLADFPAAARSRAPRVPPARERRGGGAASTEYRVASCEIPPPLAGARRWNDQGFTGYSVPVTGHCIQRADIRQRSKFVLA